MNEFTIIIQSQNRNNELRPVNSDASIDDGQKACLDGLGLAIKLVSLSCIVGLEVQPLMGEP